MDDNNTPGNSLARLHIGYVISAVATFIVLMFLIGAISGNTVGGPENVRSADSNAETPKPTATPTPSEKPEDDLDSILSTVDVDYATRLRGELDGLDRLTDEQIVDVARETCIDLQDGEDIEVVLFTINRTVNDAYNSAYMLYTGVSTYCRSYEPAIQDYLQEFSNSTEEESQAAREQINYLEQGYLEYVKTNARAQVFETDSELIVLGYAICTYMEDGKDFVDILNEVGVAGYSNPQVISVAAVGYLCPMYADEAEESLLRYSQPQDLTVQV